MPSMAAVARSLQEVYDDVEIVHLLTDAKAERTVVMTWRDTVGLSRGATALGINLCVPKREKYVERPIARVVEEPA